MSDLLKSLALFISAYAPLTIVFAIIDFIPQGNFFTHWLIPTLIGISLLACLFVFAALHQTLHNSRQIVSYIRIHAVDNRSDELMTYSVPYMFSFLVGHLSDTRHWFAFGFYMLILFWMSWQAKVLFTNPIFLLCGYRLIHIKASSGTGAVDAYTCLAKKTTTLDITTDLRSTKPYSLIPLTDDLWLLKPRDMK